jgi:hypothetical protein
VVSVPLGLHLQYQAWRRDVSGIVWVRCPSSGG